MTTQEILQGVHDWTNGKIVYDISVAHPDGQGNPTPYADLTAALGAGGANIPEPLQRGGMEVKFIKGSAQSSDNKYIRYNLIADEFTTDVTKWAIDDVGVYVENHEFVYVKTDKDNKILWAIKTDGSIYYGAGVPQQVIDYIKAFLQNITDKNIDWDALSSIEAVENPEYIEAKTDSEGKLLAGRTPDGAAFENIGFSTPKVSIDGNTIDNIEDPEGRSEVTTDVEDKILSYRDSEGVMHENVGIEASKLTLSDSGMTEFQKALKKNGFAANDWSDYISEDGDKPLLLPEPRCAYVNFTGSPLPTTKTNNYHAYIEYHDNMGNYFKKKVILNAQGSSSISYNNQKNLSIDLFDSEWDGDAFAVKIGNWVPQDSFHIKTFYMDPIRGLADVCYKYAEYVIQETNTRPNRLAREEEKVTVNGDTGIISNDYDTGALCHPDGFPCLVYHEGEFMGIYAWNLKKNRKNYMMDKNDYESVHIDPAYSNLCNLNPIAWDKMEIRNPKTLICMDGSKYDGDNPKELIDSTSEYWNNSKDQKNTVKTKNIIVGLHDTVAAINNAPTQEEKKALFSQHFDVDAYITFWLVSQLTDNWDGMRDRNTQWLYYKKSGKWCPSFYDLDNIIGYAGYPWIDSPATTFAKKEFAYAENLTTHWLWLFFQAEIVEKYNELKQKKIISSEAFMKFYNDWYERIGTEYIALNAEMWDVPCYRDGKVNKEYWKQTGIVLGNTVTYDETTDYQIGDTVTYGNGDYITGPYVVQFECIKACTGELPCGSYPNRPQTGGVFDSPRRIKVWLDAKIEILDDLIVNN